MITSRLLGAGAKTIARMRLGAANDNIRPLRLARPRPESLTPEGDPHLAAWLAAIRDKLQVDTDRYRAALTHAGTEHSGPGMAELAQAARGSALGPDRDGERMELASLLEQIGTLKPSRTIPE